MFAWHWQALPALVCALVLLASGAGVAIHERASRLAITFLLLTWTIAAWQITLVGILTVRDSHGAWAMAHVSTVVAVAILPLQYQYAVAMAGRERWRSVAWVWLLTVMLIAAVVFTDRFLVGLWRYPWGWFAAYGPAGWVFIGSVAIVANASVGLYWNLYRSSPAGSTAARRGAVLLASIAAGMCGAIDFAPTLGLGMFPVGGVFLAIAALLGGFILIRYHFIAAAPALAVGELLDALADGALVLDRDGIVRMANRAACELLDHRVEELRDAPLPTDIAALLPGTTPDLGHFPEQVFDGIERSWRTPHGARRVLSLSLTHVRDRGNEIEGAVLVLRDITAARLEALAASEPSTDRLDAATGLPWSSHSHARFSVAMARADRARALAAVLIINLDNALESAAPEQRSKMLARIVQHVQSTLRAGDELMRRGDGGGSQARASDEIVMLVSPAVDARLAANAGQRVLARLRRGLREQFDLPPDVVSVGIALYPTDAEEAAGLERRAEIAVRSAQGAGGGCFRFFERAGELPALETDDLRGRLALALPGWQFGARFAPVLDVADGALVAWSAERWLVKADGTAGAFADLDDIASQLVDRALLVDVCEALREWERAACRVDRLILPVRTRTLLRAGFVDRLQRTLAAYGIAPERVVLAVPGPLPDSTSGGGLATVFDSLAALGVPVLLDDFAAAPVALTDAAARAMAWLRFDSAARMPDAGLVARAAIGRGLGAALIAARVDDAAAALRLLHAGVRLQQGAVHGDPVVADAVPERVRRHAAAPRAVAAGEGGGLPVGR